MLLMDGATNPLLGKPSKSVSWLNAGGDPISQVNVFAKRTALENNELFGGVAKQVQINRQQVAIEKFSENAYVPDGDF